MRRLASIFLLGGLVAMVCEPASGQLFRRVRVRARRANHCCQPVRTPCPVIVESATSTTQAHASSATTESATPTPAPTPRVIAAPAAEPTPAEVALTEATPTAPTEVEISESVPSPSDVPPEETLQAASKKWRSLFDGKTLGDWVSTRFGGEGEVIVKDGQIQCDYGQYITGVTYKGEDLPKNNYEIELEAMRVDGSDFFCGLTFPVDDSHCSFIVGGWGGSVTGISSIDDFDASENDTTDYMQFDNNKWYKIRVRVTKGVLEAWIGDKKMVSREVADARLSTRIEMDPCKPLGIACFNTQAAYRNIRIRPETEADTKAKD